MAILKISDLSVGDWVKASGTAKRVHSIEFQNGEYFVHFSDPDTNSEDYMHAPFIEPIPITPEILEANGIHRTYENDSYTLFRGDGLWAVKFGDGDWELSTQPVCRVDIKYIHQLQHALRLAGVEKEIVMPKK